MSATRAAAAYFDLDGTVVAPPSLEVRFAWFLAWRGAIGLDQAAGWIKECMRSDAGEQSARNRTYLAGVACALAEDWAAAMDRRGWPLFAEGIECVGRHAAAGRRIVVVTRTLEPLALAAARALAESVTVCAIEIESRDGRWTGRLSGAAAPLPGKTRALESTADQYGIALEESFAYGDRLDDAGMLAHVGFPSAVNASPRLAKLARERGWPAVRWCTKRRYRPQETGVRIEARRMEPAGVKG